MKFLEVFLIYFSTQSASGEIMASSLPNQGIFLVPTDQTYLSESWTTVKFVYENQANSSNLLNALKLPSGDTLVNIEVVPQLLDKYGLTTEEETKNQIEKYKVETISCKEGILRKSAVPEHILKSKLEELAKERLETGYVLSIPIEHLERYYLTQGLVSDCSKENESVTIISLDVPFVKSTTDYEFKRVVALDFQNPISGSICNARENNVEYVLIRNGNLTPLPSPRTSATNTFAGFEKCIIGSELYNLLYEESKWYKVCQLDSKTLSRMDAQLETPKSPCLEEINKGLDLKFAEKHCNFNNCITKEEAGDKLFSLHFTNDSYHLTNVKKTVKVRCSNRSRDVTYENPAPVGALIVFLTCGCKLSHGDTLLVETDRCKWYSKTIRDIDFSDEKVEILGILPSKYVTEYYLKSNSYKYNPEVLYYELMDRIQQYIPPCIVKVTTLTINWLSDFFLLLFGFRIIYFILIMSFDSNSFKAIPMVINNIENVDRYGFMLVLTRIFQYLFNLEPGTYPAI